MLQKPSRHTNPAVKDFEAAWDEFSRARRTGYIPEGSLSVYQYAQRAGVSPATANQHLLKAASEGKMTRHRCIGVGASGRNSPMYFYLPVLKGGVMSKKATI